MLYFHQMKVSYFFLFLGFLFMISCDFIKTKFQENLKHKLLDTLVDFDRVDQLPSFSFCDAFFEVEKKNNCFRKHLHAHFLDRLSHQKISVSNLLNDTLYVHLKIDEKGKASLLNIGASISVEEELPVLDSLLQQSTEDLPVFFPALKRGIPVATVHQIPIVLR